MSPQLGGLGAVIRSLFSLMADHARHTCTFILPFLSARGRGLALL